MTCLKSISKFFLKKKSYFTVNKSEFWFCEWGFTNSHKNKKNLIFVVPKLKFLIHASKYSFPCQILLFYFYYYYHYYYYYYYYYYCMISYFKFLFLHEALVAMHICNALARLNFFNKGKWGCGIHTIRKFGLEWEFSWRRLQLFLGRRRFFWGVHDCISRKKWKIIFGYNFFENDIHEGVLRKEDSL